MGFNHLRKVSGPAPFRRSSLWCARGTNIGISTRPLASHRRVERFDALRMIERAANPAASGGSDHQRTRKVTVRPVSHLGDFIEDRQAVSPSEAVISVNLKEYTSQVLRTLTPREERVIKMRFGLEDGSEHTLEEVGQSFQVTRERIRQIEAKALRKLRHPSRSRKLKAFVEGVKEM